jgi:hypothetical protein
VGALPSLASELPAPTGGARNSFNPAPRTRLPDPLAGFLPRSEPCRGLKAVGLGAAGPLLRVFAVFLLFRVEKKHGSLFVHSEPAGARHGRFLAGLLAALPAAREHV